MTLYLGLEQYKERVLGGWMGKNIGGTLGTPVEGQKRLLDLTFYPVQSSEPMPNDDLDLQLVWLHALEQYGPRLSARHLAHEWLEHVTFPFDEYGYALTNLRRGIYPPQSGWYDNPFRDCMGSPIRSEIWAMIAPGAPRLAARFAFMDASVDHAGGEGVWGEMFFAAIESAAFVIGDARELIKIGLAVIPPESRVARAVRDTVAWCEQELDWKEVRARILERHGRENFTDAPQNIAFTILGWLAGSDFADAILKAVNCGYDTDCTAATLGAILGIIHGAAALPERWVKPIGDRVVVSKPVTGFRAPRDLSELTERVARVAEEVLCVFRPSVAFGGGPAGQPTAQQLLTRPELIDIPALWATDPRASLLLFPDELARDPELIVTVHPGPDGPHIAAGEPKEVRITVENRGQDPWEGRLSFAVPPGWEPVPPVGLNLESGAREERVVRLHLPPGTPSGDVEHLWLVAERHRWGEPWSSHKVPLPFVPGRCWWITGPDGTTREVVSADSRVPFGQPVQSGMGGYRGETVLYAPAQRDVRLIVATRRPLRVLLRGDVVLEGSGAATFMPAYHRPARGTWADVTLCAGANRLVIELGPGEEPPEAICVFVRRQPPYHVPLEIRYASRGDLPGS